MCAVFSTTLYSNANRPANRFVLCCFGCVWAFRQSLRVSFRNKSHKCVFGRRRRKFGKIFGDLSQNGTTWCTIIIQRSAAVQFYGDQIKFGVCVRVSWKALALRDHIFDAFSVIEINADLTQSRWTFKLCLCVRLASSHFRLELEYLFLRPIWRTHTNGTELRRAKLRRIDRRQSVSR